MHTTQTITQTEAARRLGISRPRVSQLLRDGLIRAVETADGMRLVPIAEVERLLAEQRQPGRPRK